MPTANPLPPCPMCGRRGVKISNVETCHATSLVATDCSLYHVAAVNQFELAYVYRILVAGLRALDKPVAEQYIEWESRHADR